MNERIQQLWSRAEEEIKAEYEDEKQRNRRLYNEIFLPKFAELIVKECAEVAHCNFHVDGLTLGGIMKKHFGVEL
jgi:hypothetical protein